MFVTSVRKKENDITILDNDTSILHIKNVKVLFDTEDIDKINKYKWYIENNRVVSRTIKPKKCIYLNRIIMDAKEGESIAFINGNHFDVRKENLQRRNHR